MFNHHLPPFICSVRFRPGTSALPFARAAARIKVEGSITGNGNAACGIPTAKPAAEASAAEAKPTIFFYRIKQFTGSGLEPSVYCDEKELARMDNGRYFGVTLSPGKHTCRMGDKQTGFEIDVKADQTYYAR